MLNVKHGNCEYKVLKSFGLTRPGNRTLVYRPRGERSEPRASIIVMIVLKKTYK